MGRSMSKKIVHVVGTGTIGEPLIGLLSENKEAFGIDEVTFHKNSPRAGDSPKLKQLARRGALLAANHDKMDAFRDLGMEVAYESEEAIKQATVVIDCTPSGVGIANKAQFYSKYADRVNGFIAQGSEFGFGKMYARGINDHILEPGKDQFLHVVSCNTHNIAALLKTIGGQANGELNVEDGRFLCLRRANDISQDGSFVPAPQVGKHGDAQFGTHHARDAYHLFQTLGADLNLFSSAVKLNTQYMHSLHFSITLGNKIEMEELLRRFEENKRVALSIKTSANSVFSFGREHGHYGRILSQTVVSTPTLAIRNENEVVGFCFTPQDGNSLLTSVAATLWYLDPETVDERIDCLRPYLFQEV
jgi:glyceraldehyde-3-phosphate dehydrogenase (NAD(P))